MLVGTRKSFIQICLFCKNDLCQVHMMVTCNVLITVFLLVHMEVLPYQIFNRLTTISNLQKMSGAIAIFFWSSGFLQETVSGSHCSSQIILFITCQDLYVKMALNESRVQAAVAINCDCFYHNNKQKLNIAYLFTVLLSIYPENCNDM